MKQFLQNWRIFYVWSIFSTLLFSFIYVIAKKRVIYSTYPLECKIKKKEEVKYHYYNLNCNLPSNKKKKKKKWWWRHYVWSALPLGHNIFNGTLPIKHKRFAGIRGKRIVSEKKRKEKKGKRSARATSPPPFQRVSPLQMDRAGVDRRGTKSEGPTSGLWQRGLQQIATSGEPCNKTAKKLTRSHPIPSLTRLTPRILRRRSHRTIDSGGESRGGRHREDTTLCDLRMTTG